MKFLFTYYTHKPGGLCKRLYRLQNALAASGHEVVFYSLDKPPPSSLNDKVFWQRIPFFINQRKGLVFWILFSLWLPIYLCFAVFRFKPDKLIAFNPYYSSALSLSSWIFKKPITLFLRSLVFEIDRINGKPGWLRSLVNISERHGILSAETIIFMTSSMKDRVEEFLDKPILQAEFLPNEVSAIKEFKSTFKVPLQILIAGVIDDRKNIPYVLQALALLSEDDRNKIRVTIAGDGSKLKENKKISKNLNLINVDFLGWQEGIGNHLQGSDLFIHPSLHEGLSNALVEALSFGIPVLASEIPEHKDIFQNQENLFSLTSPEYLAIKLRWILNNNGLSQLGITSKEAAQNLFFDWEERAVNLLIDN